MECTAQTDQRRPGAKAEAAAKARAIKREQQRAKKVEKDIDPSNFKIGQVHLGDIRTAHKLWTIFPHDITTTDLVMLYAGGIVVPDDMEAQFRLKFVTDHRWGLYVQHQEPQPRPSTARLVLKPPTMKKRARDAARLHAQLSSVRLRLRSPSRTQLRLRSQGPPQYAESGGRRADAQKRPRSGEHPSGQRWWYMEQHKRDTATAPTVAIRTGAELKVSENDDAHAGAVIEFSHATGYGEGPKPVAENEKRVFILSKRGDFYPETVPVGTAPPEIAAAFPQAEQEVKEVVEETVLSVGKAASNALDEATRLQIAVSVEETAEAVATAKARAASAPAVSSGDRPVEGETPPAAAPTVSPVIKTAESAPIGENEPELPEMVATYDAEVERPSACLKRHLLLCFLLELGPLLKGKLRMRQLQIWKRFAGALCQ